MAEKELPRIIVLQPVTKTVEDLLSSISQKKQADIDYIGSAEEAVQLVQQFAPCMFIACLSDNNDIPQRVSLFKRLEKVIKQGLIKTLVVSKVKNKQLSNLISGMGVTDFIEEPAPLRTVQFKANLQLKAVETIRKQQEQKKLAQEKIVFKKSEQKKEDDAAASFNSADVPTKKSAALGLKEDTFLFKKGGIKKNGKNLTLELEGPDPETGEWVQHEDKGDAKTSWRWVPNDEKEAAAKSGKKDGWVHQGEKPHFNEETQKWQMTSEKPDLALHKNGEVLAKKISLDEAGEVVVAEDSPEAEANVQKNREVATKAREDKKAGIQKRTGKEAEDKDAEEKIKQGQRATLLAENAKNNLNKTKLGEEENDAPGHAFSLESQLENSEDNSELGKINDKTDSGTPDNVVELKDKRGNEKEEKAPLNDKIGAKKETKKKTGMSPLDFLKKKKEQLEQAAFNGEVQGENPEPTEFNDKTAEGEETQAPKFSDKQKKRANDKLDALKNKLGDGSDLSDEVEFNDQTGNTAEEAINASKEEAETSLEAKAKEEKKKKEAGSTLSLDEKPKTYGDKVVEREARKKKLIEEKKDILKKIQEELKKSTPESISAEEEAELRKKHNAENEKEISPKELRKKDKLNSIKSLKDKLLDLENAIREEDAPPEKNVHDLSKEDPENTWSKSNLTPSDSESNFNAHDSDLEEEESDIESQKKKSKLDVNEKAEKVVAEDKALYLPESTVRPKGGAWESCKPYYAYLSAETRYKGFDTLESLLPIWVFKGDKIPELLGKTKQWRFYGSVAFQAKKLEEVPAEVKAFLLEIKAQLSKEAPKNPEEDLPTAETTDVKKDKNKRDLSALMDSLDAEGEKIDQKNEESKEEKSEEEKTAEVLEELESFDKPKKEEASIEEESKEKEPAEKKKNKLDDKLAMLKNALAEEEEAIGAKEETKASDEIFDEKKKIEEDGSASEIEAEIAARKEKERKERERNDFAQKLGSLNDSLAQESEALGLADTVEEKTAKEPIVEEERKRPEEKLAEKSPAISKFLERRKSKERKEPEKAKTPDSGGSFLGIFVSLSDALNPTRDKGRSMRKALRSIEATFGNCSMAILSSEAGENQNKVLYCDNKGLEEGAKVDPTSGISYPIAGMVDGKEILVGQLFALKTGSREEFTPNEISVLQKAAPLLWPLLLNDEIRGRMEEQKAA